MRLVDRDVLNTAMAVTIDTGDPILLHPKNKKPIGIRHALLALQKTYGQHVVGQGPRYLKHKINENGIEIIFDGVGSGLTAAKPGRVTGFAIADQSRKWHWADTKIAGEKIIVSSPDVPDPVAVRYAWAMNPSNQNLLYNLEGIPASPFRTDHWPLFQASDEAILVHKPEKPPGYQSRDWSRPKMRH